MFSWLADSECYMWLTTDAPNGLIIVTLIWSLMRMVNFTNDSRHSMQARWLWFPHGPPMQARWLWFPHGPYLSRDILESPTHGVFCLTVATLCLEYENVLFRGYILVSMLLKQGYYSRKLYITFKKLYGHHTDLVQTWLICWRVCSPNVTYDWFPVMPITSWRVPHVGQECSLFPEHLISLPWRSFMISPIHYIYNRNYIYESMTLVCLSGLV